MWNQWMYLVLLLITFNLAKCEEGLSSCPECMFLKCGNENECDFYQGLVIKALNHWNPQIGNLSYCSQDSYADNQNAPGNESQPLCKIRKEGSCRSTQFGIEHKSFTGNISAATKFFISGIYLGCGRELIGGKLKMNFVKNNCIDNALGITKTEANTTTAIRIHFRYCQDPFQPKSTMSTTYLKRPAINNSGANWCGKLQFGTVGFFIALMITVEW